MILRSFVGRAVLPVLAAALAACDRHSSPAGPTPTPTVPPNVAITSMSVVGEARPAGYAYRVVVHIHESAGVVATIASVDLTFVGGGAALVSSHHEQPIAEGGICPASGSAVTRELTTTDAERSHPYATMVQATITYTDGSSFLATANASTDVPPLTPLPPPVYTLTGVITDIGTHAGIDGATLEVLNGANAGKRATTDRTGTYVLDALTADVFRLRASADGYLSGEQGVTVPDIPRVDFELRRIAEPACHYTVATNAPDVLPSTGGEFSVTITRSSGTCSWGASTDDSWIWFPRGASGNGSGSLSYAVSGASGPNSRSGTIVITWTGGSAQVRVVQGPHPDWECRPVTLTKGAQDFDNVPSGGGVLTVFASAEAFPPEWSSACRATVDSRVSWISGGGTVDGHAAMTFTVAPNPSPGTPRTGSIQLGGPGGNATLTVTQR